MQLMVVVIGVDLPGEGVGPAPSSAMCPPPIGHPSPEWYQGLLVHLRWWSGSGRRCINWNAECAGAGVRSTSSSNSGPYALHGGSR